MTHDRASPLVFLQLVRLIASTWMGQAIHAATALRIPDLLADGPKRTDALADAARADEGALGRLMRALVVLELCVQTTDGAFELTPLGACLQSDSPDSLHAWALLSGGESLSHWARLLDAVRTGESPAMFMGGVDVFDQESLAEHPERASLFTRAMAELTRPIAAALVAAYDFSDARTLVDIGGGHGELVTTILASKPDARGIVLDLPHCREGALQHIEARGLSARCAFETGSFFDAIPTNADTYLLKNVLHDWDDTRARTILRNCRAAMKDGARLLVLETIVPDRVDATHLHEAIVASDLTMLVMTAGRERTLTELRALFEDAGLNVTNVVPLMVLSALEVRAA